MTFRKIKASSAANGRKSLFLADICETWVNGAKRQEMEYQVIVRRDGLVVAKDESTPSFSQQAESASGAKKKSKATGKQK